MISMKRARQHLVQLSKAKFILNEKIGDEMNKVEKPGRSFGLSAPMQIRQLFQALDMLVQNGRALGSRDSLSATDLLQILKEMHTVFEFETRNQDGEPA